MKKWIIILLAVLSFGNCSNSGKTIEFVTLHKTEFNAKPLSFADSPLTDSLKKAHDSCMGFSFDANVFLEHSRANFFLGSILNRQSLKVVNTLNDAGITIPQLITSFNVLTNPCYEKSTLQLPLKLLLGENFNLQVPAAGTGLNKEINDVIAASSGTDMEIGSWVYLDLKNAIQKIIDTTHNPAVLRYKENLLDTSNMVLTAAESVTNIVFLINSEKGFSESLQTLLKTKPVIRMPEMQSSIQLYYIDGNKFQMALNGFFPVIGEFMKAELK